MNPPLSSPQVAPEHYGATYDHRRRFLSYWNQIDQVRRAEPKTLLEVGIGNGFLTRYLRAQGIDTHSVDFDARLSPDTVASVTELPFGDKAFDVVCCFETLEHLPFEEFGRALGELRRVARRLVLLSLPDVTPCLRLRVGYGFLESLLDVSRDYPALFPEVHSFDGQHHWEIGKRGTRLRSVRKALTQARLTILSTHRDPEDPYHRFFVCEPR